MRLLDGFRRSRRCRLPSLHRGFSLRRFPILRCEGRRRRRRLMRSEKKTTRNQAHANGYNEPLAQLCADASPTLIAPRQFDPVADGYSFRGAPNCISNNASPKLTPPLIQIKFRRKIRTRCLRRCLAAPLAQAPLSSSPACGRGYREHRVTAPALRRPGVALLRRVHGAVVRAHAMSGMRPSDARPLADFSDQA